MFDVEKLAKLLKEIFTRDNENFSPELVAEELNERSIEVVNPAATGSGAGGNIGVGLIKPPYFLEKTPSGHLVVTRKGSATVVDLPIKPSRCVVIGSGSEAFHNNCVLIGNNQKSDKHNQLKIGVNDISASRDLTDAEFAEILQTFKSVRDLLQK